MAAKIIFEDLSREIVDVDDLVLVDTKVVSAFTANHFAQMNRLPGHYEAGIGDAAQPWSGRTSMATRGAAAFG